MSLQNTPPNNGLQYYGSDMDEAQPGLEDENAARRQKRKFAVSPPEQQGIDSQEKILAMLQKMSADIIQVKEQNSKIHKTNREIEKAIEFITKQYEDMQLKLKALEQEKKEQMIYISNLKVKIENLEKYSKLTTLEIRNVPTQKSETKQDLLSLVQKTCETLGVDICKGDIRDVYPLKTKAGSRAIVTEFTNVTAKHSVILGVRMHNKRNPNNKLNSSNLGFSGKAVPIYICEGLTFKSRKLLAMSKDFARSHGYAYCWTANGRVYIRKTEGQPHIEIKQEAQLETLNNQK